MKKTWILFSTLMMVALAVVLIITQTKKEPREIKIGAILPLTGDLATYGENAKEGINLLVDEINAGGGLNGKKIVIVFEDSKALPNQAVSAMNKLINIDKVIAIIGEVASSPLLSIAPIANKNKILVISPAASSPDITNAGPFIYRVWPSDVFEVDRMASYVKNQGVKSISLFYVNNDYGRALAKEFKRLVGGTKIKVVEEDNFEQNTTDVRTQLSRIKQINPEVVYLISYPKDSVLILRQWRELGLKNRIFSTSSFEDPLILKEVGDASEGVVFTSPIPPEETDTTVSAFKKNYEKRYGHTPGLVADYGYDALKVILESIRISGISNKNGVYEGIQKVNNISGATGLINFDENGDVVKPAGIKIVKDHRFVWLEK